jgi:hypothetical protein
MLKVYIRSIVGVWCLTIETDLQVTKAYTFKTLLEALDVAGALQLHVDNVNDLPLNQYRKVS